MLKPFFRSTGNLQILREVSWDWKCWVQTVSEFWVVELLHVYTFQRALTAMAPRPKGSSRSLLITPGQRAHLPETSHSTGLNVHACSRSSSEMRPKLSVCCVGYNELSFAVLIFINIKSNWYLYMANLEVFGAKLTFDWWKHGYFILRQWPAMTSLFLDCLMTTSTDIVNLSNSSLKTANVCIWFFQERDKLLRYRKQRKKMTRIPKVKKLVSWHADGHARFPVCSKHLGAMRGDTLLKGLETGPNLKFGFKDIHRQYWDNSDKIW